MTMIVRKLRLERAWSQEDLAEISGLSVRTIQRIERGDQASLESLKSLAAVFDVDVVHLTPEEDPVTEKPTLSPTEKSALAHVRDIKAWYSHLLSYVVVVPTLFAVNYFATPDQIWAIWPAVGWGLGVILHGLTTFEFFGLFGPRWEQRQVERYVSRHEN